MGVAATTHVVGALCVLLSLHLNERRTAAAQVLNLDGPDWSVRNENGSVHLPATVPGGIYSDLQEAKMFDSDLFYGYNDQIHRWVAYDNWTYSRTFQVKESFTWKRHTQLVLHGADTVGEVRLNNRRIGSFENMFVRYVFPTGNALKAGMNELVVNFTSPVYEADRRYKAYGKKHDYFIPPECVPDKYNGECHVNHLRKMQASFSWDWGPAFPSQGLWKSVELEAFDSAILRDVMVQFVEADSRNGTVSLEIQAFLEAGAKVEPLRGNLTAILILPGVPAIAWEIVTLVPDERGHCDANITIEGFQEPPRWWPAGEGEQPLLNLFVTFATEDGAENSTLKRRIAYRTVELVQEPVSTSPLNQQWNYLNENENDTGLTFYFRVNGRPIFAKGSNWIPAHVLPELGSDPVRVRRLLESARDANMNMLRVWGGGVYESDDFYDLADELGLLIWQDFMFACSMYPANKKFLSSVNEEVTQQVRRLQSHASVAIWGGNNENEGALVQNWYGTDSDRRVYARDYILLYVNTIRKTVMNIDPTRPFVVSSPSDGLKTDESGFISINPASEHYGDVHHYNYISDGTNADTYPIPRFASEYGFQSLPSYETLQPVATNKRDLAAGSRWSKSRQHLDEGYLKMAHLMDYQLPTPRNWSLPEQFPTFIFFSQISQALMVQTETEHYRRMRSQIYRDNRGLCMGALYWQLNDVWQAPSWSSIDFNGRWKALHYFAEEFFAPQMLSAYLTTTKELRVFALNDRQAPVMAVVLQGSAGRWNTTWNKTGSYLSSVRKWKNLTEPFEMNAASSQFLFQTGIESLMRSMSGCGMGAENCYLELRLVTLANGLTLGPVRTVFPVPPKKALGMKRPQISVVAVSDPDEDNLMRVVIESNRPAAFVWLDAGKLAGRFTRNAFLLSEPTETIGFIPDDPTAPPTGNALLKSLSISSLAAPEPTHTYEFSRKILKRSHTLGDWILSLFSILA